MPARTLLLVALALVVAGCAQPAADDSTATTTTPVTTTPDAMGTQPMAVKVEVGEGDASVPPKLYSLTPKKLELHVGMPVNLTFQNNGQAPHDLVIEGLDVKIASVDGGESATVEFTPMEAGTYKMYCSLGTSPADHASNGMSGEVVVS